MGMPDRCHVVEPVEVHPTVLIDEVFLPTPDHHGRVLEVVLLGGGDVLLTPLGEVGIRALELASTGNQGRRVDGCHIPRSRQRRRHRPRHRGTTDGHAHFE